MLIFLTGFMGSGKSHWGKIWAAANNFSFIDLDELIENAEGKTVAEIFELYGEDYFRLVETKTLHRLTGKRKTIIACGGGTPCFHDNIEWMNEHGITVYIRSTSAEILERVLREQEKRPLIKKLNHAELLFFIEQKLKEREPFYSQAKIILTDAETNKDSFSKILPTNNND